MKVGNAVLLVELQVPVHEVEVVLAFQADLELVGVQLAQVVQQVAVVVAGREPRTTDSGSTDHVDVVAKPGGEEHRLALRFLLQRLAVGLGQLGCSSLLLLLQATRAQSPWYSDAMIYLRLCIE